MSIRVRVPTPLRKLTGEKGEIEAKGGNISELIEDIENRYPGLKERIYDETGEIRRFINIYVNEEDIRFIDGKKTKVADGDEVSIIPAIAGG